ncbi:MAG: ATP-binding protein [Desulfobacterales bacterium]|nr:ATP-binding protein [Desulfobacterales bacterium]
MNQDREIEELCKKLKPVIGIEADKLWYAYLAEDYKGRRELSLDIEILSEKLLKKDALTKQEILLEPPSVLNSSGTFFIGDLIYNKKIYHPLYLQHEDFIKQIGIFAITGEGKTNLAYLLALQLLKSKIPFFVIDWKRSWRALLTLKDQIPELKDLQIFTVGRNTLPFTWNPFRPPPGSNSDLWFSTIADALERSHLSGPGVAYHINTIYQHLARSFSEDFWPNFFDGLKKLQATKAFERELRWKQTARRIFQSLTTGPASKVFNARSPIKLENILNKSVVLELDFEMPKPLRVFFTEVILRWIHLYRLSQGETKTLRHVLFLEEAHNLFVESGFYRNISLNSIENVYREIRAFGQGIISITQHPSLLPVYLLGNCHTQIYLGLQHSDDIRTAARSLFLNPGEETYLNLLKVGECIIKIKNRIDPCHVKIPLIPVKSEIVTDSWLKVNTRGFFPGLHDAKPQPNSGNLPEVKYNAGKTGKNPSVLFRSPQPQYQLLVDIHINPFSGVTERYKRLIKFNPKYGNQHKNDLVSYGFVKQRKIITKTGWLTLFDITPKGYALLRDLGHDVKNTSEGIEHKFWKHKISEHYKTQGFAVQVEQTINGRPDIIAQKSKKRIAIEIETGKSDALRNIQRNLNAGIFDEVICMATSRTTEEKIRQELETKNITDARVILTNIRCDDI